MASDESLSEGERFVLRLHPHWKTLLRPFFLLAVIAAAAIALLVILPTGHNLAAARIGIGVVALLAAIVWFVVPLLRWKTTTYELTTRRLRLRAGILTRTGRDFPLLRISDVSFSHGLLDRLLGAGRARTGHAVPAGRGRAGAAGARGALSPSAGTPECGALGGQKGGHRGVGAEARATAAGRMRRQGSERGTPQ